MRHGSRLRGVCVRLLGMVGVGGIVGGRKGLSAGMRGSVLDLG